MFGNSEKKSGFMIIVSILLFATLGVSLLFWRDMSILNNAYSDMNQIEFISSSTQRLISIAQTEPFLQKDVFFIGESTQKSLVPNTDDSLSVLSDVEMVLLANEVVQSWNSIERLLQEDPINSIDLSLARDAHFKAMTNLSGGISDYTKKINNDIANYQAIVLLLIFIIALVMLNNILNINTELKRSRDQAAIAQIDTATGLYNRSRCQELFKHSIASSKLPAIVVLDLNDLKKTNDSLGHRAGDELILSFANVLKDAGNTHTVAPFIGRYGGDEFIIYYEDVSSEDEIKAYLKELVYLTETFNEKEVRFKISYAVGYAFTSSTDKEKLTIRQLFDKADEAMYENKIAGKRAKNPNYDEEAAKWEVR